LKQCHEEVFRRVLETPLSIQESDLRKVFGKNGRPDSGDRFSLAAAGSYRVLMPEESPDYLKELFCSNLRAAP